jgi:hypothetical protein
MRTGFGEETLKERVNVEYLIVDGMIRFNLYFSPNIIRMSKSRRMRWSAHVERMGRAKMRTGFGGET